MAPIAEYSDETFQARKTFTLFSDKLRFTGKVFLEQECSAEFDLKDVVPTYQRVWQRDKMFWGGAGICGISLIVLQILRDVSELSWTHFTPGLMLGFAFFGVLICCATARKVEFCTFMNTSGVPLFSVARAGKHKAEFDQFISILVDTINSVRQTSGSHTEPNARENLASG